MKNFIKNIIHKIKFGSFRFEVCGFSCIGFTGALIGITKNSNILNIEFLYITLNIA
jgi:hypothetical protein